MSREDKASMEPLMPASGSRVLEDLSMELAQKGAALAGTLNPIVRESIGHLVRSMNCYYSNLIEGHHTHPRDIDKALSGDFEIDPVKRQLQLEAVAHIEVQRMIDTGASPAVKPTLEFLCWAHREFCSRLPDELLQATHADSGKIIPVVPGELRAEEVIIGKHLPPPPHALTRFIARFEQAYDPERLSRVDQVIAAAASHHRLLWIHPFLDSNGRVARLFSHAWLAQMGIGSTLWSVSRGLARRANDYKAALMAADMPRQGDLDGRGNLSEKNLTAFCVFFLQTAIDQVEFMSALLDTRKILTRMELHVREQIADGELPKGSYELLREAWLMGEYKRGQAAGITGYKARAAREVLSILVRKGYLGSDTEKGPVRLLFPARAVERWLPMLYPEGD